MTTSARKPAAGGTIPSRFRTESFDRTPWVRHAIHVVISLAGRLDADLLHKVVRLTLDAEPILGCRFVEHWFRPYWQRYEDLDGLPFFEIRETEDSEQELTRFLVSELALPVRVLLLREKDSDRVCIKFAHRVGDGVAVAQFGCLLAYTYNALHADPHYRPVPRMEFDRSIRPVSSRFSIRQRLKLFREAVKTRRRLRMTGHWTFPPPDAASPPTAFVIRRLSPERVRRIGRFAYQRRATAYQVLVAAFFVALCDSVPHSGDRPLQVLCPVDLRRYLGSQSNRPLCNLTGQATLALNPGPAATFDDILAQVRDQMYAQWGDTLGLSFSAVPFDIPVLKHVMALVPYSCVKRNVRASPVPYKQTRRAVEASQGGEVPLWEVRFADVEVIDAFGTGGGCDPGQFGLGVTTFAGSVTVSIGSGPSALVHEIWEGMRQRLPE